MVKSTLNNNLLLSDEPKYNLTTHLHFQVAGGHCDLSRPLGKGPDSWALTSDGVIVHNSHEEYKMQEQIQEGDVIVRTR